MKELYQIKKYFKPIQPTIKNDWLDVSYIEVIPENDVENFIYCFWQLKTNKHLKHPFQYRVVSDGCIDIFFDHTYPTENFIMGFCRKYTAFPIGNSFDYIGIRFLPSAFPLLMGINAKTLSNQSQELKHILPGFSNWISTNITSNQPFEYITKLLNEKFKNLIRNKKFELDLRFYNPLILIFQNKGLVDIHKDLATGLSSRQLRRVFNYYIGTTPKAFSNVVRFQHILNAKLSNQSLKENKFYFDVGFYDQAHFIKHFKTFYGVTPAVVFK